MSKPSDLREAIIDGMFDSFEAFPAGHLDAPTACDAILDAVIASLPEEKEIVEGTTDFTIAMNWANPRYNEAINDVRELLQSAKSNKGAE